MTILRGLLVLIHAPLALAVTSPTDLIYGHYEIHVDYTVTPGNPDAGWRFSVSYDEDDDFSTTGGVVRMAPESTLLVAGPKTRGAVPNPAGVFSRFGPAGTPLWIFPQNQALGALYLGVRTTMSTGLFQARVGNNYTPSAQGSVSLRLVSVEGTGPDAGGKFATWKTESFGTTVFSLDSTNGITAADEIPTIPVSSHTHYNWGLTKPGLYRVTLEAKGKLMPTYGSAITSAQKTFLFAVPFSSRVASGAEIRLAGAGGLPIGLVADPANSVAYVPEQAMLEASVPATSASSALPGAQWELSGKLTTLASSFPNGVGVSPSSASAGLPTSEWSSLTWSIKDVRGPGGFAIISNGIVLADGAGDSIPIAAGAERPVVMAFSQTGIYRATGVVNGFHLGSVVVSPPFTLVFGAGLTAEFSYSAWQASFETTGGLVAGALASPAADLDRDGLANGVEYAFFWHGLDPTVPDAGLMPAPAPTPEGYAAIKFLRDTYKDPLDETLWQIRPSYSENLQGWNVRSSRVPGLPLGIFETSAEAGNALGRILRRSMRVMPATQTRAFFRFHVTNP